MKNKAAHLAVGVDADGKKEVLGIWIETTEGAKSWLRVMNELNSRVVEDVLIVVCDGLTGPAGRGDGVLAGHDRADLHRAPDAIVTAVGELQRAQACLQAEGNF